MTRAKLLITLLSCTLAPFPVTMNWNSRPEDARREAPNLPGRLSRRPGGPKGLETSAKPGRDRNRGQVRSRPGHREGSGGHFP